MDDPELVDAFAAYVASCGAELDGLMRSLGEQTGRLAWTGPRSDCFRQRSAEIGQGGRAAAGDLADAGARLRSLAAQLRVERAQALAAENAVRSLLAAGDPRVAGLGGLPPSGDPAWRGIAAGLDL